MQIAGSDYKSKWLDSLSDLYEEKKIEEIDFQVKENTIRLYVSDHFLVFDISMKENEYFFYL